MKGYQFGDANSSALDYSSAKIANWMRELQMAESGAPHISPVESVAHAPQHCGEANSRTRQINPQESAPESFSS